MNFMFTPVNARDDDPYTGTKHSCASMFLVLVLESYVIQIIGVHLGHRGQ